MKKIYTLLAVVLISATNHAQIVISQVYGGGGNSGATYPNDYIELYNRGTVAVDITGWSVQYASATGKTWGFTALPSVSIEPGKYFLIKEAAGTNPGTTPFPTADLDGLTATTGSDGKPLSTGLAMSGSNGKVILVNSIIAETTENPTGAQIIDKVAYGTTPTAGFEGTGPTGTALTSTTAALRKDGGKTDTNDNKADFTTEAPFPRNSAYLSVKQNTISGLNVYPNPVKNGNVFITSNSGAAKSIAIYDILGKQVLSGKTANNAVSVSALRSGTYILRIAEEGKVDTKKLIIE